VTGNDRFSALRSDDTDARREARRRFGRSDRSDLGSIDLGVDQTEARRQAFV
jgi:hypothetical protein